KNHPKHTNKIIKAIRGTLEHRAAWLYLLLDEAEKRGIVTEEFANGNVNRKLTICDNRILTTLSAV
ncbi:MAG TPA: hypothetical protein VLH56_17375, partial [Dissulfurispiraceae bacterium]|nr:hypothetical protein [Dissulfurispiraceae bacterium]